MRYVLKKDIVFKAGTEVDMACQNIDHGGPMGLLTKGMGKNGSMTLIMDTKDVQFNRYFKEAQDA